MVARPRLIMSCSARLDVLLSLIRLELLLLMATLTEGRHCFYGELSYRPGEVFSIQKGCNSCTCLINGLIGCTDNDCREKITCRYRGATYLPGETIKTSGPCSLCICGKNGYVACRTQRRCEQQCTYKGRVYSHGLAIFDHETCEVCRCFRRSMSCFDDVGERIARCRRPPLQCRSNGKLYSINEAFTAEDGCTVCICRSEGYIACSKHRCRKDFCTVGNQTLALGESTLIRSRNTFSGQSKCAMCRCDEEAQLHCDRSHEKCRRQTPTEGVCVYKNKIYYEAGAFLEVVRKGFCRQCLCNRNGIVSCAIMISMCPRKTAVCTYMGQAYVGGDVFIQTSYNYHNIRHFNDHSRSLATSTKQSFLQYLNEKLSQALGSHLETKGSRESIDVTKKVSSKPVVGTGVRFGVEYKNCRLCTCGEEGEVDCKASRCRVRTCTYHNKTFYSGQNFTIDDGCRSCVCTDRGTMTCVSSKCKLKMAQRSSSSATAIPRGTCEHQGAQYKYREQFKVRQARRCLNCMCTRDGKVQCRDSQCKNSSSKGRSSCNYVVFGMFISTLRACKLVE